MPLTIETVFGGAMSFLVALLWYYIRALADRFKEAEKERSALRERLHAVEKDYQTKGDARDHKGEVLSLLKEIKTDLAKVNEKLDRKADK